MVSRKLYAHHVHKFLLPEPPSMDHSLDFTEAVRLSRHARPAPSGAQKNAFGILGDVLRVEELWLLFQRILPTESR